MSLLTTLSIASSGLSTSQYGLQVVSQNIANVNTQGYKRSVAQQEDLLFGMGVRVNTVNRQLQPFAERRLLEATSDDSGATLRAQAYKDLDNLFNDTSQQGLSQEFQNFFKSLQDLAARPAGTAERSTVSAEGANLGSVFSFLRGQLESQTQNQDTTITSAVSQINTLAQSIADLNRQIASMRENQIGLNDLLNQRDEAVRKISEFIPVSVVQDTNGNYQLFIKESMPLVSNVNCYQLVTQPDPTNDLKLSVLWQTPAGTQTDITSKLTSGQIGAAIQIRDKIVDEQMTNLDHIAAEFVLAFNQQHRAGTGLDGVTGRDFFNTLPVSAKAGTGSQGGAGVTSATVVNEAALTLHDYQIQFTGPAIYNIVDMTTGATLSTGAYTSGAPITFDGLQVTISDINGTPAAGDYFKISNNTGAADNVTLSAAVQASTNAIAAGLTGKSGDNQNALTLANIQSQPLFSGNTHTIEQEYQSMLVNLGTQAAGASTQSDSFSTILNQVNTIIQGVSGVNTDEESTQLMAYQRAYQASAKVISVTDEMMLSTINMIQ